MEVMVTFMAHHVFVTGENCGVVYCCPDFQKPLAQVVAVGGGGKDQGGMHIGRPNGSIHGISSDIAALSRLVQKIFLTVNYKSIGQNTF